MITSLSSLRFTLLLFFVLFLSLDFAQAADAGERPRARDIGIVVGIFPTGRLNAITDVAGVQASQNPMGIDFSSLKNCCANNQRIAGALLEIIIPDSFIKLSSVGSGRKGMTR